MGPLAQLVEQGTFNPMVVGSSPTRPISRLFPRIIPKKHVACWVGDDRHCAMRACTGEQSNPRGREYLASDLHCGFTERPLPAISGKACLHLDRGCMTRWQRA